MCTKSYLVLKQQKTPYRLPIVLTKTFKQKVLQASSLQVPELLNGMRISLRHNHLGGGICPQHEVSGRCVGDYCKDHM